MRAEWEPDELIDAWTLTGGDWDLVANKAGVTRLGLAVMLKFYEIEGRFPACREEVPQAAVAYLGSLVTVEPALFAKYSWRGLSPLFWSHVNPYGRFRLDMDTRLDLTAA